MNARLAIAGLVTAAAFAQSPAEVLVVVNEKSALSKTIGEYYVRKRGVPARNVCRIRTSEEESIDRATYDRTVAASVGACLRGKGLTETILYIVTTSGVPLRVEGAGGLDGDVAAVDSELCLLYAHLKGAGYPLKGAVPNPFFGRRKDRFSHPAFPMYLVTRLAGYSFEDIKGLIDRSLLARNQGKVVIDMNSGSDAMGENWLRDAVIQLPDSRVVFEQTSRVVAGERDVIGYASWGSNDSQRRDRVLGFRWLPGAIMTEYVSTNARTFERPPDSWRLGTWKEPKTWFAGAPQTLIADYIREGVTGVAGHVAEPYLHLTPRPDYLLPAYLGGRNLAESYYLSIPALSWQNIVVGDPLCTLGKP